MYFTHDHWQHEKFLHPSPVAVSNPEFTAESGHRWYPYLKFRAQSFTMSIVDGCQWENQRICIDLKGHPYDKPGFLFPDSDSLEDLVPGTDCQLLLIAKWHPIPRFASKENTDYLLAALWVAW